MPLQSTVIVRTDKFMPHRYPNAKGKRRYLRHEHWHAFNIRVEVIVQHNDRDVELHDLRELVDHIIEKKMRRPETKSWSCESWAAYLADHVERHLDPGNRVKSVEVWEDHAHGARVERQ